MKATIVKALDEAFNARERYRQKLAEARTAHKDVRDAEEHVRHVRRIERDRASSRSRGRAA